MAALKPLHAHMSIPLAQRSGGSYDFMHPTLNPGSVGDVLVAFHEAYKLC